VGDISGLAQWLIEENLVTPEQLKQAQTKQNETGVPLEMALLELDLLKESALVDLLARRYGLPKAPNRLHRVNISLKALSAVPQDLCWQCGLFPFGIDRNARKLQLAVTNPSEFDPKLLGSLADFDIDLFVIGPKQLGKAIRKHYLDSTVEDTGAQPRRRFFGYDEEPTPVPTMGELNVAMSEFKTPAAEPEQQALDPEAGDSPPLFPPDAQAAGSPPMTLPLPTAAPQPEADLPLPEPVLEIQPAEEGRPDQAGHHPIPTPTGLPRGAVPQIPKSSLATPEDLADLAPAPQEQTPQQQPEQQPPPQHALTVFERVEGLERALLELLEAIASSDVPDELKEKAKKVRTQLQWTAGH
jgi:hypothetical protein